MSGAKRKTKYRKHVEASILDSFPEPSEGQKIVKVLESRGGNILEVTNEEGDVALCLLPSKFRKLVWVKRGNFVIASYSEEEYATSSGKQGRVKYTVEHILFKDQIKHLVKANKWPKKFADEESQDEQVENDTNVKNACDPKDNAKDYESDNESDSESDSDLFVNTNRLAQQAFEEEDSDSSEEEEEEEEQEEVDNDKSAVPNSNTNTSESEKNAGVSTPQLPILSFDLDDTIWHCEPVIMNAVTKQHEFLLESFPTLKQVLEGPSSFSMYYSEAMEQAKTENKNHDMTYVRKKALETLAKQNGIDPIELVEPAFTAFHVERCRVTDHIFPGVLEVLNRLKEQGFTLVSLTNGNCDLSKVDELNHLFEKQVTAEHAGAAKPHPAPFQRMMELSGVQDASHVIHIGDSLTSDVAGAKSLGLKTIWVNRQKGNLVDDHGAHAVISCVSEIETILGPFVDEHKSNIASSVSPPAAP